MVTSILTLAPPGGDVRADIKNARLAREKLDTLIATLKAQRDDARATFMRAVAADLAGLKDAPSKAFAEAEFAKCTTANNAAKEFENRIQTFENLSPLLDEYVEDLADKHHDEFIELLNSERAALEAQRDKDDADKALVESRIEAIDAELAKWSGKSGRAKSSTRKPKAAGTRKPASRK